VSEPRERRAPNDGWCRVLARGAGLAADFSSPSR
jgi:hypothetical protein